jgi:hypothetical protein
MQNAGVRSHAESLAMTTFEHLSTLISIILGLGLTHLLSSVRELIQKREKVRFHWLPVLWAMLIFLAQIQWWWGIFELRLRPEWNFFAFLYLLLAPVSMYLTAGMVLPDMIGASECDLKAYYFHNRSWLFGLLALSNLLDATRDWIVLHTVADARVWSNLIAAAMFVSMAIIRRELFHTIVTLLVLGLFLYFVVVQRLTIG